MHLHVRIRRFLSRRRRVRLSWPLPRQRGHPRSPPLSVSPGRGWPPPLGAASSAVRVVATLSTPPHQESPLPKAVPTAATNAVAVAGAMVHPSPDIALSKEMMPLPQPGDGGGEEYERGHRGTVAGCWTLVLLCCSLLFVLLTATAVGIDRGGLWRLALVSHVGGGRERALVFVLLYLFHLMVTIAVTCPAHVAKRWQSRLYTLVSAMY